MSANAPRAARFFVVTTVGLLLSGCGTGAYEQRLEQTINEKRIESVHGANQANGENQAPAEGGEGEAAAPDAGDPPAPPNP